MFCQTRIQIIDNSPDKRLVAARLVKIAIHSSSFNISLLKLFNHGQQCTRNIFQNFITLEDKTGIRPLLHPSKLESVLYSSQNSCHFKTRRNTAVLISFSSNWFDNIYSFSITFIKLTSFSNEFFSIIKL